MQYSSPSIASSIVAGLPPASSVVDPEDGPPIDISVPSARQVLAYVHITGVCQTDLGCCLFYVALPARMLSLVLGARTLIPLTLHAALDTCFPDQVHDQNNDIVSTAELQRRLLGAGACEGSATLAWVDNHVSLIAWQLARTKRSIPVLQGRLLAGEVVLDQLKYRHAPSCEHGWHCCCMSTSGVGHATA